MSEPARQSSPTVALHDRAMDNLRFIRETMESSSAFTSVPGWGTVAVGMSAMAAAIVAASESWLDRWLLVWLIDSIFAMTVGGGTLILKARRSAVDLHRGIGRKFHLSLSPPIASAAVLPLELFRAGATDAIPGMWLLLYGVGIVAAGAFSVRAVPVMGAFFIGLGVLSFGLPSSWMNAVLALGFGGFHIVFGVIVARRHGG